jgi:DNA-binding IscR family transcriptional regulator
VAKLAWPSSRVERTRAVQDALTRAAKPVTVDDLAKRFSRANKEQLTEILEALTALGLAKSIRGKYSA